MPKAKVSKKSSAKKSNIFVRAVNKFSNLHAPAKVLVLALTIGVIGSASFAVYSSFAASYLDKAGCDLRGRVWVGTTSSNPCSNKCQSGAGSIVSATPYNYCSGAISKISSTACSTNNRKWVSPGCARRWQQTSLLNAVQCKYTGMEYIVASPYDKCKYVSVTTP